MSTDQNPQAEMQARQRLATLLLAKAVHVTFALDRLHELAAHNPHDDPTATAEVAEAIAAMIHARTQLIEAANRLTTQDHP